MPPNEVAHYCQKCLAANPLGQDFCARCGTRLMIVVEPAALRYENTELAAASEEHLLERISVLENRLLRLTDRIEKGLDLLLRQAQNSYFDRALLKSLISLLSQDGLVKAGRLERLWNERCQKEAVEQEELTRREQLLAKILSGYHGTERSRFEEFVNDGFLLIADDQVLRGVLILEQAAEMSADNTPLLSFLGEHFFRIGKNKLAREYLARAFEATPEDNRISLMLGLVCGDDGDTERAKQLLSVATLRGGSSFAAHYGLGRLFVAERKWQNALREFKRALAARPSPEAHYALGCLYYQLVRDALAGRHLRKAIEMDGGYTEALHVLGLVYARAGQRKLAKEAFAKARAILDAAEESPGGKAVSPRSADEVRPLFQVFRNKKKRLFTGGDTRLARAVREDALRAFRVSDVENR